MFDYQSESELDRMKPVKAKQLELVITHYKHGDRVRWNQPTLYGGRPGSRVAVGTVEWEVHTNPGFYYVRDDHDKRVVLVFWADLERA